MRGALGAGGSEHRPERAPRAPSRRLPLRRSRRPRVEAHRQDVERREDDHQRRRPVITRLSDRLPDAAFAARASSAFDGARVEAARPALREAELFRGFVERDAVEVVALEQMALGVGLFLDGVAHERRASWCCASCSSAVSVASRTSSCVRAGGLAREDRRPSRSRCRRGSPSSAGRLRLRSSVVASLLRRRLRCSGRRLRWPGGAGSTRRGRPPCDRTASIIAPRTRKFAQRRNGTPSDGSKLRAAFTRPSRPADSKIVEIVRSRAAAGVGARACRRRHPLVDASDRLRCVGGRERHPSIRIYAKASAPKTFSCIRAPRRMSDGDERERRDACQPGRAKSAWQAWLARARGRRRGGARRGAHVRSARRRPSATRGSTRSTRTRPRCSRRASRSTRRSCWSRTTPRAARASQPRAATRRFAGRRARFGESAKTGCACASSSRRSGFASSRRCAAATPGRRVRVRRARSAARGRRRGAHRASRRGARARGPLAGSSRSSRTRSRRRRARRARSRRRSPRSRTLHARARGRELTAVSDRDVRSTAAAERARASSASSSASTTTGKSRAPAIVCSACGLRRSTRPARASNGREKGTLHCRSGAARTAARDSASAELP